MASLGSPHLSPQSLALALGSPSAASAAGGQGGGKKSAGVGLTSAATERRELMSQLGGGRESGGARENGSRSMISCGKDKTEDVGRGTSTRSGGREGREDGFTVSPPTSPVLSLPQQGPSTAAEEKLRKREPHTLPPLSPHSQSLTSPSSVRQVRGAALPPPAAPATPASPPEAPAAAPTSSRYIRREERDSLLLLPFRSKVSKEGEEGGDEGVGVRDSVSVEEENGWEEGVPFTLTLDGNLNSIRDKEAFKRAVACVCNVELKYVIALAKPLSCRFKNARGLTKPMPGRVSTMSPPLY